LLSLQVSDHLRQGARILQAVVDAISVEIGRRYLLLLHLLLQVLAKLFTLLRGQAIERRVSRLQVVVMWNLGRDLLVSVQGLLVRISFSWMSIIVSTCEVL
jgi:hypothetical protein